MYSNYVDSCNETASLGKAVDLVQNNNIIAFIGPACSDDVEVVGRLASYKGIPLLTGLGDVVSGERSTYSTLIRTSYDLWDEARAILAFLSHLKWHHFGLIYRYGDVYYQTLADQLVNLLGDDEYSRKFFCECKESYVRDANKTILTDLVQVIDRMTKCARMIIGGEMDVRAMMKIAHQKKMTHSGEYAFIHTELIEGEATANTSWAGGAESDETKQTLKEAYQALLIVSLNQPPGDFYKNFSDEVKQRAFKSYNYTYNEEMVNYFTASFHDSVLLLCRALHDYHNMSDSQSTDGPLIDGRQLVARMKNVSFSGISGDVTIDSDGDRIADYALLDQTDQESGHFNVVMRYFGATKQYVGVAPIHWPNGKKPVDLPECGFDASKCPELPFWDILTASLLTILVFLLAIAILIYRKVKLESALTNMSWRVRWEDITFPDNVGISALSRLSISSQMSNKGMETDWVCWVPNEHRQSLSIDWSPKTNSQILTGFYKGNLVAIKRLPQKRIELTRDILLELKVSKDRFMFIHESLRLFALNN
ncbi:unnamed protein product [Medioppia subpectinata]|uniref:Receptor ligand binding region domain-containing protein n=1 Tax=Medioppia subpectinata TaxID=1979941 RepID=A0A7R9KVS8_9ACAR|nr:unnamed protein product [Medioppia subpectinata]CAG2110775.1 unnamed protein product [Medioppia subpectinata]